MMKITIPRRFALALIALFAGLSAYAQTSTITGVVRDTAGDPIVGAAVMVKGTTNGVMTNADGSYSIKAKDDAVLVCQLFGYKTQEQAVGGRSNIDFTLADDTEMLEATVVVGYGTLKKTQLVGSVENLDGDKVADRPNPNLARSLQGQVAGLNIIQTDGKANHSGNVYIRTNAHKYTTRASMTSGSGGAYSIGSGDGSALVLIDGVEGSLGNVNPSDIETVAVLKDASSAAIYGARAYNGVILVTTKEAKGDKFTISYNGTYSYNDRTIKWEDNIVTDGLTWLEAFYAFTDQHLEIQRRLSRHIQPEAYRRQLRCLRRHLGRLSILRIHQLASPLLQERHQQHDPRHQRKRFFQKDHLLSYRTLFHPVGSVQNR